MANKFQLKRTTVSGRTANTTNSGNTAFIDKGELAVNLADRKVFSSDSSNVIFEIGSNLTNLSVTTSASLKNDVSLNFETMNGNNVTFKQQADDNFVFYTTNTAGGQRAVWSIFANSVSSNLRISTQTTFNGNVDLNIVAVFANGSSGTAGQVLTSNGTSTYWQSLAAIGTNVNATYAWTNTHSFAANVSFSNNISITSGNSSVGGGLLLFNGLADGNWKIGRNTNDVTKWYYTNNTLDILAANSNLEGIVLGNPLDGGTTYIETGHAGTFIAGNVTIGNTSSKSTINSTTFSGTANNASFLGGNSASDLRTYTDNRAANAYSNAVSYTDTKIGTANTAMAANAATAYTNAVSYTDTKIGTANTAMVANAAAAYSNAVTYTDTKIGTANTAMVANAAAAYSNAVTYTDTKIGTANTAMVANAAAAYTNAVSYTDTKIGTANTAMVANAAAAYTNATVFAANASNANNGTLAEARLPFRMNQNVRTIDNVEFVNVTVTGNITISGTQSVIGGNSLSITDNMIYMNQGVSATITNVSGNGSVVTFTANNNYSAGWDVAVSNVNPTSYNGTYLNIIAANATHFQVSNTNTASYVSGGIARGKTESNPDLGFAFGYNDGTYHHGGFFRDATDGIFKVFDNYDPEPDTSVYIDTANNSFHLANFQANVIYVGNTTVYSTINTTSFSGTANNATNLGGSSLATVQGQITGNAATAYTNAVSYTDTKIGTANTAMAANAAAAYSNAVTYIDTKIGTANTAMAANAAAAYSNAVTYTDTKIGTANTAMAANAAAAYSNAVTYTDTKIGTANTAMAANAATAYTNAVSYTDTKIGTANTAITGNAATAYTNAITIAANATNLTSGTVAFARLPSLYLGTTAIQSTSAAQAVSGITTLAAGNTTITGFANVTGNLTATNPIFNNIKHGYSTTVTAAGTTTLTSSSNYQQFFTGTTTQIVSLPAPQTMTLGQGFLIVNNSTGSLEVRAANAAVVITVLPGTAALCISIDLTAGNGAAGWSAEIVGFSGATGTGNVVLASSPTLTGTTTVASANITGGLSFSNGTSNFITWSTAGVDGPSINSRSPGTKLLLYPALSASQSDYAMGIAAGTMWSSVPRAEDSFKFKWFGADIDVASISGAGNFRTAGYANVGGTIQGGSSLTIAGALSGVTTAALGNTTITGFANVTSTIQGGSSLTIAGAASGITTLAAGNTTITGFANVSTTLQVGTNTATFGTAAYIVANGNVGIGTTSPSSKIHTFENANSAHEALTFQNSNTGAGAHSIARFFNDVSQAGFYFNSSNRTLDVGTNGFGFYNDATGGNLQFRTPGHIIFQTASSNERVRIASNGNIGIGNTAPGSLLVVAGTAALGNTTITGFANVSTTLAVAGISTFSGNVVLGSVGVSANGGFGTAGQVLHSNGTATYWAADDNAGGTVTSVATGNGLTGGTITSTGTVSVLANTGIVANATGLFVNSAYIATISANNASYLQTKTWEAPGTIGSTTANSGAFTTITASGSISQPTTSTTAVAGLHLGYNVEGTWSDHPFLLNDLGNLRLRGGTFTANTTHSLSDAQKDALFDGQPTYCTIDSTTATFPMVLEFTLPQTLFWGSFIGISFGTSAFRSNTLKIEAFSQGAWVTCFDTTSFTGEQVVVPITGNAGVGTTSLRFTFANPAIVSSSGFRINNIWAFHYASAGWSNLGMPRAGGQFYGNVSVNSTSTVAVGGNTLNATTWSGSANNADYLDGQHGSYYTNATNITTGTLPYAQIPANVINTTAEFTRTGITTFSANVVLGSSGVSANASFGTAGHVLHSNGTATYWAADDQGVTSVATANGLSGGTITSTGTLGVTTGSTLTVNTAGIHVNSALQLASLSLTGDLTVSGNLTVSGTRTYVNTTTLDVGDNIITLNADLGAVAPSQNAGLEIMRGTSANVQFLWDETNDRWSTNGQPMAVSSLVAAGAASGITTLAAGNTTITGFANVTSTIQGGSSLTIAGAASGITTLAAGNTTVTGFANVTSTLQVGGVATFAANANFDSGVLFVDGTNNRVGINNTAPGTALDIGNTQGAGITMRYDATTAYRALITPYWNSSTDTRIDFAINNTGSATPTVYMTVGYGGNVGIGTQTPGYKLTVNGNGYFGDDLTVNGGQVYTGTVQDRVKYGVWDSTAYGIGMISGVTFGGIENDYAMTFQFNDQATRGFWWGDNAHTLAQGAMALTTDGKLTVAHSARIGFGESDTSVPGSTYALEVNGAFAATTKSFLIDHPTKPDMKLRYGSLEGPENGVYVRGRLKDSNIIELPDYWTGLVDENTITVNLTAIGKSQDLWVEDIADNKVVVGGENINCFYTVFAERKDVDKLEVEF